MTGYAEGNRRRAGGAATLFLVAVLLLVAGLIVFHAARVAMTDQRLTANDVLAFEAQAAAEAGLESAFSLLASLDASELPFDPGGRLSLTGPAQTLANGAGFTTRIHNEGLPPGIDGPIQAESTGIASDGVGRRQARQLARHDPWLPHPPPAPLIAGGDITLDANTRLRQPSGAVAAWAGGDLSADPAAEVETAMVEACDGEALCGGDPRLTALGADRLAANFLGRSPEALRARTRAFDCEACDTGAFTAGDGRPWWLSGVDDAVTLAGGVAGSPAAPVMLIIDGNLEVSVDTHVRGLLLVRGDWRPGAGRLTVSGAVIVTGAVMAPALDIDYDAAILERLAARGPYTRVSGSWIDF